MWQRIGRERRAPARLLFYCQAGAWRSRPGTGFIIPALEKARVERHGERVKYGHDLIQQ